MSEAIYGGGGFTKIPGLLIRTPDPGAPGPRTAKLRAHENLDELPFMAWDRIDFSKFVFDRRRHFYRVGIHLRSFFGNGTPAAKASPRC